MDQAVSGEVGRHQGAWKLCSGDRERTAGRTRGPVLRLSFSSTPGATAPLSDSELPPGLSVSQTPESSHILNGPLNKTSQIWVLPSDKEFAEEKEEGRGGKRKGRAASPYHRYKYTPTHTHLPDTIRTVG